MTVPTSRSQGRYVHEAVYYETTRDLVEATVPLLREALDEGDDVALACTDAHNAALVEALGEDRVVILPRAEVYTKAVAAVAYFRDFVQDRIGAGATRVCVLGEVDFGTDDRATDEWRRYEALLNHALDSFPVWSLCAYDTRTLSEQVLATGELTHPYLRRDGVRTRNPLRIDPSEVLRLADAYRGPAPAGDPALTISDVLDLEELHHEVGAVLADVGVKREVQEDLVVALHEIVINSIRHGAPPVTVSVWTAPDQVQCAVTDRGAGFDDPFVGYVRGGGDELPEGRFGLWLARQLCDEVSMGRAPDGFTTRLVVDV